MRTNVNATPAARTYCSVCQWSRAKVNVASGPQARNDR